MSGNVEAKTTHEFTAPAEDVFDAWLDPVKVRSWFAEDARTIETDPQVGG
ncbi:SRPBCC family protein [Corynebacterium casei]